MIVELTGMPGSGKSTIGALLADMLRASGLAIKTPAAFAATLPKPVRIALKTLHVLYQLLAHPLRTFRFAGLTMETYQKTIWDAFDSFFNALFVISTVDRYQHFSGIVIMDQGILQSLSSIAYSAKRPEAIEELVVALTEFRLLPNFRVRIEAGDTEIRRRLGERVRRQSRLEGTEDSAFQSFRTALALSDAYASKHSTGQAITIPNELGDAPHEAAATIARALENQIRATMGASRKYGPITRPLKIGIFTRPIDQGTSGSGFHLLEIINQLLNVDTFNEYVLIHAAHNDRPIYKRCRELIVPRNPLKATGILRREGFDVLHYNPLTIISPLIGIGSKKVATIHGASILFLPEQFSLGKRLHARFVLPMIARWMDGIATVSETSARFIESRYRVDRARIRVCPNAVAAAYSPSPETDSPTRTNDKKQTRILHISKYSERKNPWTLLEAFAQVSPNLHGARLVLVGSGWKNPAVESWLTIHGLLENVDFSGFVTEEEKIRLLRTADLFVFPSLYEGFGMPNLEAMACGCPVVTSSVFAIPEVVSDAAILVKDPRNATELASRILEILRDDALRSRLIERGLERVKAFSWTASALTLRSLYEDVCK